MFKDYLTVLSLFSSSNFCIASLVFLLGYSYNIKEYPLM